MRTLVPENIHFFAAMNATQHLRDMRNTLLLDVRKRETKRYVQKLVNVLVAHLKAMQSVKGQLGKDAEMAVHFSKAKLKVYYAILQEDKAKCLLAIDAVKSMSHVLLDSIMEGDLTQIVICRSDADHYIGKVGKTGEHARQMGRTLKDTIDRMEVLCEYL